MIIHIMSFPIVIETTFRHALVLMRAGSAECVRLSATGVRRWACGPVEL